MKVDYDAILSPASYLRPKHWLPPGPWQGHAPFAAWLMDAVRPDTVVELGSHYGFSLFTFAEAAVNLGLDTRIVGVDAWAEETMPGPVPECDHPYEVVQSVAPEYPRVEIKRAYFDAAVNDFEDGSIDILHIDGGHSYEEVESDFTSWIPKVNPNGGVILLHDVHAWRSGFGAYKLWQEIEQGAHRIPALTFEFYHSWGLGVAYLHQGPHSSHEGTPSEGAMYRFMLEANANPEAVREVYHSLAYHNEMMAGPL